MCCRSITCIDMNILPHDALLVYHVCLIRESRSIRKCISLPQAKTSHLGLPWQTLIRYLHPQFWLSRHQSRLAHCLVHHQMEPFLLLITCAFAQIAPSIPNLPIFVATTCQVPILAIAAYHPLSCFVSLFLPESLPERIVLSSRAPQEKTRLSPLLSPRGAGYCSSTASSSNSSAYSMSFCLNYHSRFVATTTLLQETRSVCEVKRWNDCREG